MKETLESFGKLLKIMDELREKCPWDRKQTYETLRTLTIEETYELADAIINSDEKEMSKELGDILLHLVFYAKIGSERGSFDMKEVIDGICQKLIYRHPHVFGQGEAQTARQVEENWESLKLKEGKKSVLSGVPKSLPAMVKANRIQQKVRGVGFDWEKKEQIWDKVAEELDEVKEEVATGNANALEQEFGDLLFSIINAARLYGVDPETALERTNKKFIRRFSYLENETLGKGRSLHDMSLDEMNSFWEQAKSFDKNE
ncbi:MAG: nucleoside triphosphate pyrophosphohydrolase [Bacteroidales bacterium]